MKKICLILSLLLVLCLCLCACGEDSKTPSNVDDSTNQGDSSSEDLPEITGPQGTDPITPDYEGYAYCVQVIDSDGNPVSGVFVQICAGDTCVPVATDENGIAAFPNEVEGDGELVAKIMETTIPEGYHCVDGITEISLDGETNVGFVLTPDIG